MAWPRRLRKRPAPLTPGPRLSDGALIGAVRGPGASYRRRGRFPTIAGRRAPDTCHHAFTATGVQNMNTVIYVVGLVVVIVAILSFFGLR